MAARFFSRISKRLGAVVLIGLVAMAAAQGEGACALHFLNSETGEAEPKLSYVKLFAPWGWIVGTGSYVRDIEADIAAIRRAMLVGLDLAGLAILAVSTLLRRSVTGPLAGLRRRVEAMTEGDTDSAVPSLAAANELGDTARAVEGFRTRLIERAALEARQAETARKAAGKVADARRTTGEGEQVVRETIAAIDSIARGSAQVA